jgi:hypothetical protein
MSDSEPTLSDIAKSIETLAQSTAREFGTIHKVLDVVADDLHLIKGGISDISRSVQSLTIMAGDHERRLHIVEQEAGIQEK